MSEPTATMVDVAFPLAGRNVPRDHRRLLAVALERELAGLCAWPGAGVHRIKVVAGLEDTALLPRRARLLLRVPRVQADALAVLEGREIDLAGHRLRLGRPQLHELLPHRTLYADLVAAAGDDEIAFLDAVSAELREFGVSCRSVCGRGQAVDGGERRLAGFSLMLDELSPADSLCVLERGVGAHRRLGCGLFVPHRSAAAVGA